MIANVEVLHHFRLRENLVSCDNANLKVVYPMRFFYVKNLFRDELYIKNVAEETR